MVSIIKNQLLKHLSRYTKNLSSDKINLSTFRGEGELSNLQLDEDVLTDLLELPGWLRLTSAWCNHVSFRITWTKLKSVPITLTLDEVNITVETCEVARSETLSPTLQGLTVPQGKYSFIHKVIDGITIIVNTVNVRFISPAFTASVQMSRIRVESKTPKWLTGDLRVTRLKDPHKGIILIFKELSWQTVRIEASSTQDSSLTPLRLLTNHARCRITIRKRLSDCNVLASRLVLILDDLLWVLTDSQLKAALHFVDSLSGLIKATTSATQKTKAQKKLETLPEYQAQIAQQNRQTDSSHLSSVQKMFNTFDVRETSYHFFSQRIDLHLCDDEGDGRSSYPDLKDGGAFQISVQGFQIDYYPYHLAKSDRSHWAKYKESVVSPALWLEQSLNTFREAIVNLSQHGHSNHSTPLEQVPSSSSSQPVNVEYSTATTSTPGTSQTSVANKTVLNNLAKLMSACVVLRIEDFTLYRVTTSGKKQTLKEFVAGDKDRYSFPPEMPVLHSEFTYFYYPGDFVFPLPPSKIFVYMNPIQIHFDLCSILWLNSFAVNLHESLLKTNVVNDVSSSTSATNEPSLMYMDVKFEGIMPRIIIESPIEAPTQRDRPKIMQIQISRIALTNVREIGSSRADLADALHSLQEGNLIFGSGFPSIHGDMCIVTDRILSHVAASDVPIVESGNSRYNLHRYMMWHEPRDVWCIKLDPIWIDFLGARSLGMNKSIPFVDAVPITIWLHKSSPDEDFERIQKVVANEFHKNYDVSKNDLNLNISTTDGSNSSYIKGHNLLPNNNQQQKSIKISSKQENTADLHAIVHISNLVSVQIDHYQYLFLLRMSEELTELTTFLTLDTERILKKDDSKKSLILACVIPQVEVTLVMPSSTPGKESSGGDGESVLPDSASLGTNITWPTPPPLEHVRNNNTNPFGSVEMASPVTTEAPAVDNSIHSSNPNAHGYNVQIQGITQSNLTTTQSINGGGQDFPQIASSSGKNEKSRNSIPDTSFSKEINSSLLSMKKGFTSFMTSIDSALKTGADDISDTFSFTSDASSDSEKYSLVIADEKPADCMDIMFRLNPFSDLTMKPSPIEVASEVCEEPNIKTNLSSPSEPSEGSSWKRRDLVSMVTFRLTTVELIRQNIEYKSSLRLQVAAVSCDECGSIPWDELQTKFCARCKAWNIAAYNPEAPPVIQLRMEETLNPPRKIEKIIDRKSIKRWFSHNVEIRVKNLALDLSMSTVIGLGDLTEDEVIMKPLPANILLENVQINLIEDRPPVNITSPGPIPINLAIGRMNIRRDENGIINIQPQNEIILEKNGNSSTFTNNEEQFYSKGIDRDRELLSLQIVLQQLKLDNENLRKQLNISKDNSESHRLKISQENEVLRTYLKAAQDDISTLLNEKKTLLDTIRSLQNQLTTYDLDKKNGSNR